MKTLAFLMLTLALVSTAPALAFCSHGCGPGFGPRPFLVGGGAVAFRRAERLEFRAQRAASFGLFGRANRLQDRSNAAFNRGLFRNARFNGF